MKFPQDYPNMPPTLKITSDFWQICRTIRFMRASRTPQLVSVHVWKDEQKSYGIL